MPAYNCFCCHKVIPILDDAMNRLAEAGTCPSCGGIGHGEIIPTARVKEGFEDGVFFNIVPKTGGRAKKKRR